MAHVASLENAASMPEVLPVQNVYLEEAFGIPALAALASIARAYAAAPLDAFGYPSISAVGLQVSLGKLVLNNELQFVMKALLESRIFQ